MAKKSKQQQQQQHEPIPADFIKSGEQTAANLHAQLIGMVVNQPEVKPGSGVLLTAEHAATLMVTTYAVASCLRRFVDHAVGLGIDPEAIGNMVMAADMNAQEKTLQDRAMQIPPATQKKTKT
jgi:hypothetical protein